MAYSPALTSAVLRCFIAAITGDLRRRARKRKLRGNLQTGALTVIQRFGSAIGLNVHFHTLALDGVYARQADGTLLFHPLPAPADEDVARIARSVCRKVHRLLARQQSDDDSQTSPLDELANASVLGLVATGPRRGCRVLRLGATGDHADAPIPGRRCADVAGFNVHANTCARANDRERLEHLVKYLARPPIANDRLTQLPDGRLALKFKQPWRDGTTHTVFTPHELIEKLIPLIPRPRAHVVRYHGILGPAAKERQGVVPRLSPVELGRSAGTDLAARNRSERYTEAGSAAVGSLAQARVPGGRARMPEVQGPDEGPRRRDQARERAPHPQSPRPARRGASTQDCPPAAAAGLG
jgi:hypothetical protein